MTVDSIIASPAATTPALKSTFGVKPSVSLSVSRNPVRSTTLLTQWSEYALVVPASRKRGAGDTGSNPGRTALSFATAAPGVARSTKRSTVPSSATSGCSAL